MSRGLGDVYKRQEQVTWGHPGSWEVEKVKLQVENSQKVFTACRLGFKVCGRYIDMSRLIINQLR